MYKTLLFSITDNIATITFNRPEAMNSFDKTMGHELALITDEVKDNLAIRAVLLNGAGHLFMAGGDIRFFYDSLDKMPAGVIDIIRSLNISIINLMYMPKPVLACVHGSVAGVGISLMLACDLVIAAENTKFTTAYCGLGISPDGGATFNLPRTVGSKKSMEWLLLSDLFDATDAKTHGLINWVVPEDTLAEKTSHLLKRLANGPTQSYIRTKQLINQTWNHNLENQLEKEAYAFESCSMTSDFKTGVSGFINKKKPQFAGQ